MLLETEAVTKVFGGRRGAAKLRAVDGVTLKAEPGKFVAIVGESGSGKSTLARMMLDLMRPTSGRVLFDGEPLDSLRGEAHRSFRRSVQAVLQDPSGALNPRKTVVRAIGEVIRLHAMARSAADVQRRVCDALEQVGMNPAELFLDRYPHELSGGQRQRVLIARALVLEPQIIIADEAVSALDASVKAGVLRVMVDISQRLGIGYVFITHDLPVVRKVADEVCVMKDGAVVEHGPKNAIVHDPQHPYTRTLLAAAPELDDGGDSDSTGREAKKP
ncbi:MAG: ATP-binding cassette domain-containing protein [Microbacterium sp.]